MHNVQIAEPEALQQLLAELKGEDADQAVADRLGIDRSTFRNLRVGRVTTEMSFGTYSAIIRALGGEPEDSFDRGDRWTPFGVYAARLEEELTAATPEARRKLSGLLVQVEKTRSKLRAEGSDEARLQHVLDAEARARYDQLHPRLQRFRRCIVTGAQELAWQRYVAWMRNQLSGYGDDVRAAVRGLWACEGPRRQLKSFLRAVHRDAVRLPPPDDLRCWLALSRAVEPLTHADASSGLEPRAEGEEGTLLLGEKELNAYLRAALKKEELLMKPTRYLQRVAYASR